jgi:hypothetical protein
MNWPLLLSKLKTYTVARGLDRNIHTWQKIYNAQRASSKWVDWPCSYISLYILGLKPVAYRTQGLQKRLAD